MHSANFSIKTVQRDSSFSEDCILLLPCVDNASDEAYYPAITSGFRKNLAADLNVNVRTFDPQCKTILRKSADIVLPIVEISWDILISIGTALLSEAIISFIERRVRPGDRDSTTVHLSIRTTRTEESQSTDITYEGPVNGLKELSAVLEEVEQK